MLATFERMGNALPPRLKVLLNITITLVLLVLSVPLLWLGFAAGSWSDASLGSGLFLLGVFNLFT